ncbi:MAG: hypothetical protein AAGK04_04510, partial [Planctomycetota bacterium]
MFGLNGKKSSDRGLPVRRRWRGPLALRDRAGAAPVSRRGNFFVVVVGTLALLSVIAVAYVSVGRSDRRLGGAVSQSGRVDEVVEEVQGYLLDVISNDVTAPFDEIGWTIPTNAPDDTDRIETWDAPWTRWDLRSVEDQANPNRTGAINRFVPWGNGDDPWLA